MDSQTAHQYFSGHCFNEVWNLLEKSPRSAEEERLMREMAHASLFHWLQRDDCAPKNVSVGLWLISRVYVVLDRGSEAEKYAAECVEVSQAGSLSPFYLGYAFEASARAGHLNRDQDSGERYLALALAYLSKIEDQEEKDLLRQDLDSLEPS